MRILTTCLSKCEEVLEQSAEVFAEVKESSLLQEICQVEEGRNKLRGKEGGRWRRSEKGVSSPFLKENPRLQCEIQMYQCGVKMFNLMSRCTIVTYTATSSLPA